MPGCVFHSLGISNHRIKTLREKDETVTRFRPEAFPTTIPGYVYGGLIASQIDCIPLLLCREGESFDLQGKGQIAVPGESDIYRTTCGVRPAAGAGLVSQLAGFSSDFLFFLLLPFPCQVEPFVHIADVPGEVPASVRENPVVGSGHRGGKAGGIREE